MTAWLANVGVQSGFSKTGGEQISKIRKRIMPTKIAISAISGAALGGPEACRSETLPVFVLILISEAENRLRGLIWRKAYKKSMRLGGLRH